MEKPVPQLKLADKLQLVRMWYVYRMQFDARLLFRWAWTDVWRVAWCSRARDKLGLTIGDCYHEAGYLCEDDYAIRRRTAIQIGTQQ